MGLENLKKVYNVKRWPQAPTQPQEESPQLWVMGGQKLHSVQTAELGGSTAVGQLSGV